MFNENSRRRWLSRAFVVVLLGLLAVGGHAEWDEGGWRKGIPHHGYPPDSAWRKVLPVCTAAFHDWERLATDQKRRLLREWLTYPDWARRFLGLARGLGVGLDGISHWVGIKREKGGDFSGPDWEIVKTVLADEAVQRAIFKTLRETPWDNNNLFFDGGNIGPLSMVSDALIQVRAPGAVGLLMELYAKQGGAQAFQHVPGDVGPDAVPEVARVFEEAWKIHVGSPENMQARNAVHAMIGAMSNILRREKDARWRLAPAHRGQMRDLVVRAARESSDEGIAYACVLFADDDGDASWLPVLEEIRSRHSHRWLAADLDRAVSKIQRGSRQQH